MNKLYSINPDASVLTNIKNTLLTHYGVGFTFHRLVETNASSDVLIFSIPTITEKVFKLTKPQSNYWDLNFALGDSYSVETSDITNATSLNNSGTSDSANLTIICMPDALVFSYITTRNIKKMAIFDKLSNGDTIAMCLSSDSTSNNPVRLSDMEILSPILLSETFTDSEGRLYKSDIILKQANGCIYTTKEGDMITLKNVKSVSYYHSELVGVLLGGSLFSACGVYNVKTNPTRTSLYIENVV